MDTQKVTKKIYDVKVTREVDTDPDTSDLGEYTDTLEDGVIVRQFDEFYEKLPREMERNSDGTFAGKGDFIEPLPERGREYRGFKPYAGGEEIGTKEYYKYGMQDYKRMEDLERQNWYFVGVRAIAHVGVSFDGGKNFKIDKLTSGGLWGIESDSDESYFKEVEEEELDQLKSLLLAYGFGRSKVERAIKEAEREN